MATELIIYTDESDKGGEYFSNFYGGVLVRSGDLETIIDLLNVRKLQQNLFNEIKWQKVTENYLEKYIAVMDSFFDAIAEGTAKVRIMFTNNQFVPRGLTSEQRQTEYHRLYYQFIKHAFGMQYASHELGRPIRIRLNLDQMPTSSEETAQFKSYVDGLNRNSALTRSGVKFSKQQIAEVNSKDHVLLQCLDIVLGAMAFRLNNKHLAKPTGQRRRGKRTIAKEKLYKHISARIRDIYPNFNIGESTGKQGDWANLWRHPYRHWKLVPKDHERDWSRAKP
jgi:hypothetical protein